MISQLEANLKANKTRIELLEEESEQLIKDKHNIKIELSLMKISQNKVSPGTGDQIADGSIEDSHKLRNELERTLLELERERDILASVKKELAELKIRQSEYMDARRSEIHNSKVIANSQLSNRRSPLSNSNLPYSFCGEDQVGQRARLVNGGNFTDSLERPAIKVLEQGAQLSINQSTVLSRRV